MPTPGYVFKGSGLTPEAEKTEEQAISGAIPSTPSQDHPTVQPAAITPEQPKSRTEGPLSKKSSDSHALAVADHEVTGAAQAAGLENATTDLGWKSRSSKDVDNFVGGLQNDELWTLVRRFNKQMYHVKAIPQAPPGRLDLNIADEDEFSPDKLRSNIERLYMTIGIGLIGFVKHIARLRSWREPRRTGAFAAVYFIAWLFDFLVPTAIITLMTLILVPRSREILFPPAPLALVSKETGGVQKPKAGVLGSHDSVTGAPEAHAGMAVEQEASNFVNGMASVAIASAAGAHDQSDPDHDSVNDSVPDPANAINVAVDSKAAATGGAPTHHDKTKAPMEDVIWQKMRPAMHILGNIADTWERVANVLSPTPPFSHIPRYRLAAVLLPILFVSSLTTSAIFVKANTFLVGAAFFSDPLLQRGIQLLNEKVPDWQKYLELRNSFLKGVPTNAQLTITLLRIGEANRAPLPPPPPSKTPPPEAAELDKDALAASGLDATTSEIDDVITIDTPSSSEEAQEIKPKKRSRILSFFKGTTAGAIETKFKTDNVRAVAGSAHAKDHLGILPKKGSKRAVEGPTEFKGRYKGKKGAVYVDSTISPPSSSTGEVERPCLYFTTSLSRGQEESIEETIENKKASNPEWIMNISDIVEIKKVGGLGWKTKIVVGWATEREVKEGLELTSKDGTKVRITALRERDELFNRLVSMGAQVWESY